MTAITAHRPHAVASRDLSRARVRSVGRGGSGSRVGAAERSGAPGVHLTGRGRVVVLLALLVAIALAALVLTGPLLGGTAADAGTTVSHPTTRSVVVEPGQTLWQIAAQADPHADVRDTVAKIMELNALSDSVVRPGTRLAVPAR